VKRECMFVVSKKDYTIQESNRKNKKEIERAVKWPPPMEESDK
jgi:hypothetical protein